MPTNTQSRRRLFQGIAAFTLVAAIIGAGVWLRRGHTYPDIPIGFNTGQKGVLRLTVRGDIATGSLRLAATNVSLAPVGARFQLVSHVGSIPRIDFPLPAGEYAVKGRFAEPGSYRVIGEFPAPLHEFAISGVLPTATQPGYYGVMVAGKVASGAVPALDGSTPSTPFGYGTTSDAKAPQSPHQLKGQISQLSSARVLSNSLDLPLAFCHVPAKTQGLWTASFILKDGKRARQIVFSVQPPPAQKLQAGQKFSFAPGSGNSLSYSEFGAANDGDNDWDSLNGIVIIDAVKNGNLNFSLRDVRLKARDGGKAQGTFVLNAKGSARATDR